MQRTTLLISVLAASTFFWQPAAHAQCDQERWLFGPMQDTISGGRAGNAVVLNGDVPLLIMAGSYMLAGQTDYQGLAAWDGNSWQPYPSSSAAPRSQQVYGVAMHNGELYISGGFGSVNNQGPGCLSKWNGTQWVASGTGLSTNSTVYNIISSGSTLWATGDVLVAGGAQCRLAKLENGAWSASGLTISTMPTAMTGHAGDFFVAGSITAGAGSGASKLARYSGGAWTSADTGLQLTTVAGLRSLDGELYALGGTSSQTPVGQVYKRTGDTWAQVGQNLPGWALDIVTYRGATYTILGHPQVGIEAPLYRLDGAAWTPVFGNFVVDGNAVLDRTHFYVRGDELLVTSGNGVTMRAYADRAFDTPMPAAGSYRPETGWQATLVGFGPPQGVAQVGDTVLMGNSMVTRPATANGTVRVHDAQGGWRTATGLISNLYSICAVPFENGLLVGGQRDGIVSPAAQPGLNKLVKWNDAGAWPVTRGLWGSGGGASIKALAEYKGRVFAAPMSMQSGTEAMTLMWWDGTQWQLAGKQLNGTINSLCVYDGKLIAGGGFTAVGAGAQAMPAPYVMAFDGSNWSPLGTGLNGAVTAVTVYNGRLYAIGSFTGVNPGPGVDAVTGGIACWDGERWRSVDGGLYAANNNPGASAMRVYRGSLYVVGNFSRSGSKALFGMARFDGDTFDRFGGANSSNTFGSPTALFEADGELYLCGNFVRVLGQNSRNVARWQTGAIPAILSQPATVASVTGGTATVSLVLEQAPLTAQWFRLSEGPLSDGARPTGAVVSGSSTPSLTISGATAGDSGEYQCLLTYPCGAVRSGSITVRIAP